MTTLDLELLERQVRELLERDDREELRGLLAAQHPTDVADVIDRLDDEDQLRIFRLLAPDQAAEVLDETSVESTRELILHMPAEEASDLLELLPTDEAAAILSEDVPERQAALLEAMEPGDAAEVRTLLSYPPQSAGRLMNEAFVRVRPEATVASAMEQLRAQALDIETLVYLYVLDPVGRLLGVVTLRKLLIAQPEQRMDELMRTRIVTVPPETDQEEVARLVSRYDLSAIPVVTADGRMLGIVSVDDVIDVLVEEGTEDVLRFGGVERGAADETYFTVPVLQAVRRRIVWLLLLFLAGTITGNVLRFFEDELAQVVALSFFIPLLIGTGGNTGAQTVSTLIRALALGEVRGRDVGRVLARELVSGLILGVLLGAVAFGRAWLWDNWAGLAATVALSVVAICVWANVIGALVPMAARRFKLDPALVSAPLITTLVDASGLAIYLGIAKLLLGL